nr:uncharacterized protein LOC129277742 isoform X3 [Lytechinus pictus]
MELSSIDTPVLVSACLLVLAFLIGCSRGRDTWIFVDFLATSAFGLGWYFIPDIILGFQINVSPDGTHLTYTRAFAACMIGDAVSRYFLRSSKDASTLVYLLFSRIVGCSVLIISMIYIQYFGGSVWNQNHIFFGMLGNMLWMMGSIVYYYQSRYSGGHAQLESRLNMHLRLDGFLTLLIGCSCYAFPDFYLKMQVRCVLTFSSFAILVVFNFGSSKFYQSGNYANLLNMPHVCMIQVERLVFEKTMLAN